MQNWHALMVASLAAMRRREGHDFDRHWQMSVAAYPPRARLQAVAGEPTLFDEQGEMEESEFEFFKRACRDAYYDAPNAEGKKARVRHFRPEMLAEVDHTEPARRAWGSQGRHRQAA